MPVVAPSGGGGGEEQPFLVKSWAWQTHCFSLEESDVQDTTGTRQHQSHHPTHWPPCRSVLPASVQ